MAHFLRTHGQKENAVVRWERVLPRRCWCKLLKCHMNVYKASGISLLSLVLRFLYRKILEEKAVLDLGS